MDRLRGMASSLVLAGAFAVFVQMTVVLTGRVPAGAFVAALAVGAVAVALLVTPHPLNAIRDMPRRAVAQACAGGLMAVAGAPAFVAALRMSDAPAGSIVVFWVSGGWAAIAACAAAAMALRDRRRPSAAWCAAGALLALAGVAGVVADWERPSSFSPLVRFAPQEIGMLFGGVLMLAGGLLIVRAARSTRIDGAVLWAAGSSLVASFAWWAGTGFAAGWGSLAEQPLVVGLAALAWGAVCTAWPATLKTRGPAAAGAALSVTPVLLSGLILLEQAVGVAGPQPLIVPGVVAGSLLIVAAVFALGHAGNSLAVRRSRLFLAAAAVPALLAVVGLALPALTARADVTVTDGLFSGSWSMSGVESVAAWSALALAVLVLVTSMDTRPVRPVIAALAASAAWPWLLDVPTHVWSAALAPEIQQYYGTEYGSISFIARPSVATLAAVVLGAVMMLGIIAMRRGRTRGPDDHADNGGS